MQCSWHNCTKLPIHNVKYLNFLSPPHNHSLYAIRVLRELCTSQKPRRIIFSNIIACNIVMQQKAMRAMVPYQSTGSPRHGVPDDLGLARLNLRFQIYIYPEWL